MQPIPRFEKFADDPVGFARDVLGLELWGRQADLARAVVAHQRVACRSGHKVGKTTVVAVLAWWFAATRAQARAVCTAPTDRQVRKAIWREVKRLRRCAKRHGYVLPEVPKDPRTGVQFDETESEIFGFSTNDPDNFSGISAPHVIYLCDEASGIAAPIFEAIHGNRAAGAKFLMTGNPTQPSGELFDAFNSQRHLYHPEALIHISSADSPNVTTGEVIVPGLATRAWVEEMREAYGGPGNPIYDVRVDGNFPSQAADTIIGVGVVEAALGRFPDTEPGRILDVGVDVARFGDDLTVVQAVRGLRAYEPRAVHGYDTGEVAGLVIQTIRQLRSPGERVRVKIDTIGYGAGVFDQIRRHYDRLGGVDVVSVNSAEAATDPSEYFNLRSELHFVVRDWLVAGGALAPCPRLESDLVAPRYRLHTNGTLRVEAKDDIKKRIGRSTDYLDALALAVFNGGSVRLGETAALNQVLQDDNHSRWSDDAQRGF